MAGPMTCDLCEAEVAEYLIGNTQTGEQQAVGAACLTAWCIAQLTTRLDAEATQALATELYKSTLPPEEPETPAPRRGRKRASEIQAEEIDKGQQGQEVEAAPTAGDG